MELKTYDRAGNTSRMATLSREVPALEPSVIVTEVLANPKDSEPDGEFVELLNIGSAPVSLEGWRLSDDLEDDGDPLPGETLFPGEFALVVSSDYDPFNGEDPAPASNALMLYLESSLGSGGLANKGEPVFLKNADGVVVSALQDPPDLSSSKYNGVSMEFSAPEGCGVGLSWQKNRDGTSTPGAPNSRWETR